MKINLSFLKNKLLTFFFLIFTVLTVSAQTTLVNYQFNNNLNPDGGAIGSPVLTYHASNGTTIAAAYNNNMLSTSTEGHYLELTIDTSGRQGLILSFDGDFAALFITGAWNLSANTGAGGTFENLGGMTLFSIFNIRTSDSFSTVLPIAANNNANLKLRITSDFTAIGGNLRLDNLKLTSGSPNIRVYSSANTYIPHLSPATLAFDTDFGTRQTTDPLLTREFRVRNFQGETGSQLNVTNITVTGANPGDFSVTPTALSNIAETSSGNGTFKSFTIGFLPLSDGLRTAQINVYSNAAPSPYIFYVVGTGASCSLTASTFAVNNMASGQQSLVSNYSVSTDLIGGQADNNPPNTINTVLYPNAGNLNLYVSSPTSWYVRNGTKEVEFGGTNGLDISGQKNVSIEFRVAAFGNTSANTRGVNNTASVTLSIQKPDLTWTNQMILKGSDASGTYFKYAFTSNDIFESTYINSGPASEVSNRNTGFLGSTQIRYGTFRLNLPASANISNLKFKISATTPQTDNRGLWLIDDVKVVTSNAVFRTWNGTSWSSSKPTPNEKAVFTGNYNFTGNNNTTDLSVCECEVENTAVLTIPATKTLTVRNKVINNGTVSNFIVKSDGNLIQVENDAVNSGPISARRIHALTPARKEYNYISSPVRDQNMKLIFGGVPSYVPYVTVLKESTNRFVNASASDYLIPARGFSVKEPTIGYNGSTGIGANEAEYKGVPNNGNISIPLNYSGPDFGYNVVGNPYPSNLDIIDLYNNSYNGNNISPDIRAEFKFWDNSVNNFYTQMGSAYSGWSFAVFNLKSGPNGMGVAAPGDGSPGSAGSKFPTRVIKVSQAFSVRALAPGASLNFNNSMRRGNNASTFFGKQSADDSYRLELTTPNNLVIQNAVTYFAGGNSGLGIEDSFIPNANASDAIFNIVENEKIIINGNPVFSPEHMIPLGTRNAKPGTYLIRAIDQSGVFANGQAIYLKDKELGIITNISEAPYSFESGAGEFTNRFEIVYQQGSVLATEQVAKSNVVVYRDASDFVVKSTDKVISTVEVYDGVGRLVMSRNGKSKEVRLPAERLINGMYILGVKLADGEFLSKKIRK